MPPLAALWSCDRKWWNWSILKMISSRIHAGAVFTKVPRDMTLYSSTVSLHPPSNVLSWEASSSLNVSPAWWNLEIQRAMRDVLLHQASPSQMVSSARPQDVHRERSCPNHYHQQQELQDSGKCQAQITGLHSSLTKVTPAEISILWWLAHRVK